MKVKVLMVTYNRVAYTQLALERLCQTLPEYARLTVWDNNSKPEMKELLRGFEKHPRVEKVIFNPTNDRLRPPTRWFWENSKEADFVSKVDDDCLMPEGWCEKLVGAHKDIPDAGVLGCWRFLDEDFAPEVAAKKIQKFESHQIMRNCWVEGSGYLMKRAVIDRIGNLRDESFTNYCTRAAAAGFINGWYYPFLYQEHMDDPRVPHTGMQTEADFQRLAPLSAKTFKIRTREDWINRLRYSAWSLQACSYDPRHYLGWRAKLRRALGKLTGKPYVARA